MLRLIRGRGQERGAVAVIVALVVGMFVLTGVAALTIDAGRVYAERRVLQNGADAAALALAQICANNLTDARCSNGLGIVNGLNELGVTNGLKDLAGANAADDHKSSIYSICGSAALVAANPSAFPAPPCSTLLSPGLVECPITTSTAKYVEVRTRTLSNSVDDPSKVPGFFAGLKSGAPVGKTVQACSRAGWGPLGNSGPALPLVIGVCEWNNATAGGTRYAPAPTPPATQYTPAPNQTDYRKAGGTPYTPALSPTPAVVPANTIVSIIAHTSSGSNTVNNCPANPALPAGQDYPGGFGWTTADTTCSAIFADTGNLTGDGGGAPPQDCRHKGPVSDFVGKIVNIPIFTNVAISNGIATYTISGLSAFYLAGYANISTVPDMFGYAAPASLQCVPGDPSTCIWGWFTEPEPDPDGGGIGGGTSRGPIVLQVLG